MRQISRDHAKRGSGGEEGDELVMVMATDRAPWPRRRQTAVIPRPLRSLGQSRIYHQRNTQKCAWNGTLRLAAAFVLAEGTAPIGWCPFRSPMARSLRLRRLAR